MTGRFFDGEKKKEDLKNKIKYKKDSKYIKK